MPGYGAEEAISFMQLWLVQHCDVGIPTVLLAAHVYALCSLINPAAVVRFRSRL